MSAIRGAYRWLIRRLPPRAAWVVWRGGLLIAGRRRRRVPGPDVALARVAWGVPAEKLGALVEDLLERTSAPRSQVMVVSDSDAVHVAAARGCRMEHVPGGAVWSSAFPEGDYDGFLAARGRAIRSAYRIGRLEVAGDAPPALVEALGAESGSASGSPPRRSS
jgi:hypothetical protein